MAQPLEIERGFPRLTPRGAGALSVGSFKISATSVSLMTLAYHCDALPAAQGTIDNVTPPPEPDPPRGVGLPRSGDSCPASSTAGG